MLPFQETDKTLTHIADREDGKPRDFSRLTDLAKELPRDTVIMTAGCAKYRYNKLDLGDIGGIPRVLDAGQCNDSYSIAAIVG